MKKLWQKALQHYQFMSKREQILVVASLFLLVLMLWYVLLWGVIESQQKAYKSELAQIKQEVVILQTDVNLQNSRIAKDPNQVIQKKRDQLRQEIKKLDVELGIYSKQLLTARGMMKALKDITVGASGVEMKAVDVLPDEQQEGTEGSEHPLYRHGVRITFLSNYFSTMAYLEKMESLPWRLFWDRLDYQVVKYPESEVLLQVHTLSEKR